MAAGAFYIAGGTLSAAARCYVERRADRDLGSGLSRGEFCYVLTSRQMGKSSLMVRTAEHLRAQGINVVTLDLTGIGSNLTPEQWYDGLMLRIGAQLRMEDELEDYWVRQTRLGPCQRLFAALREVALERLAARAATASPAVPVGSTGRLVLFVDEIDVVRSLPFRTDEFFSAIRESHNRRAQDPVLERLTFCLLGVAMPADLIGDPRVTPFNVGRRIELTDFTPLEAKPLAAGLARTRFGAQAAPQLLGRILHWTSGHPYLTQRLCQALLATGSPDATRSGTEAAREPEPSAGNATDSPADRAAEANNPEAEVDRLCERLFLSPRAREQDDNLLFVRERLLRTTGDLVMLLDLYEQIHQGQRPRDDETSDSINQLRLAGIVRTSRGSLEVRNHIYRQVFDANWLAAVKPLAELIQADGSRIRVKGTASMGRTENNDIQLPDLKVSRRHALLQKQGKDELWLLDLGSRNGTFVNGKRIAYQVLLRDGDRVEIGPFAFTFHQPHAARRPDTLDTALNRTVIGL